MARMTVVYYILLYTRRRRDPHRIVKVTALTRSGCRGCECDVRRTHILLYYNNIHDIAGIIRRVTYLILYLYIFIFLLYVTSRPSLRAAVVKVRGRCRLQPLTSYAWLRSYRTEGLQTCSSTILILLCTSVQQVVL